MTITQFEDLVIWQKARELCAQVYAITKDIRDFGFNDQIQRAAVSIMNNIAEGFDRSKNTKDNKQFISFLNISYGSCGEVKSMLYLAETLTYCTEQSASQLRMQCISISEKIRALISTLQGNDGQNNRLRS